MKDLGFVLYPVIACRPFQACPEFPSEKAVVPGVQRQTHRHCYFLDFPRKFRLRPLWWLRKSSGFYSFDTLDHGILLKRLHDIGVRHTALEWFKFYLDERTFIVKIGHMMFARCEVRSGVPQGSVLGPMLFSVYCLPTGDIFAKHNVRYHIYADDIQLYVECPQNDHTDASRQIAECVEDLRWWLTDNRLLLNEDKTEAILFRSSGPVTSTINIGGSVAQFIIISCPQRRSSIAQLDPPFLRCRLCLVTPRS